MQYEPRYEYFSGKFLVGPAEDEALELHQNRLIKLLNEFRADLDPQYSKEDIVTMMKRVYNGDSSKDITGNPRFCRDEFAPKKRYTMHMHFLDVCRRCKSENIPFTLLEEMIFSDVLVRVNEMAKKWVGANI